MKKTVIVIKEDVEIAEGVFLSKGDMLIEKSKGRWTLIEDEDEDDKEEMKEEDDKEEMDDEEDKEDEKEVEEKKAKKK